MPRYFFHVHDGQDLPDMVGTSLPDLPAARLAAVRLSGRLLTDKPETFWQGNEWKVDVTDETGLILFTLLFMAVDAPCSPKGRRG